MSSGGLTSYTELSIDEKSIVMIFRRGTYCLEKRNNHVTRKQQTIFMIYIIIPLSVEFTR